jgi:hypothetical protein
VLILSTAQVIGWAALLQRVAPQIALADRSADLPVNCPVIKDALNGAFYEVTAGDEISEVARLAFADETIHLLAPSFRALSRRSQ